MTLRSSLYLGHVMHRRRRPKVHALRYRIFWLLLDLEEIEVLSRRFWLFSHNRFNAVSFFDADHGMADVPLRDYIERLLRGANIGGGGRITLLAMPRIFHHVFNPLSVYFCHDTNGALTGLVYEVHNTFGERHAYVLPATARHGIVEQETDKTFYVSPFMDMEMRYAFRVSPPNDEVRIAIRAFDEQGTVLSAVLTGRREPLSNAKIFFALLRFPLMTLKVVAAIHWNALQLWLKGIKIRRRRLLAALQPR